MTETIQKETEAPKKRKRRTTTKRAATTIKVEPVEVKKKSKKENKLKGRIKNTAFNLKQRFKSINDRLQEVKKRTYKTYKVVDVDTPNDYEYIEAKNEADAIAKSKYVVKDNLIATLKSKYNCFIIDSVNGCCKTFIEDRDLIEQVPDAKQYDFDGERLYYLYRKYSSDRSENVLLAYQRPTDVKVSPDMLYDAINWAPSLKRMLKTRDTMKLEKLNPALLLGLVGMLLLMLIIVSDM